MPEFPAVGPAVHFPPIPVNKNDGPFMREEFLRWLQRQSVQFANLSVTGDIKSANWDGASPANLASVADSLATMGFYLDSSVGAIQIAGPIYIGRDDRGHIKAYATGVNVFGLDFIDDDLASAASININGDAAAGADLSLHSTGTVGISAVNGLYVNNVARDIFLAEPTRLVANDGSTGNVEIFPKGTLITMGNGAGAAVGISISTSLTERAVQTIAVDYASQPVYVEVTVDVEVNSVPLGNYILLSPTVMGSAVGQLIADGKSTINSPTGTAAPGTDSDASGSSSSTTGSTQPAVTGTSGAQSAGTAHTHTAGSYTTTPDPTGHNHGMTHTHSHSHTVDSHSHTTSLNAPVAQAMSRTWRGTAVANGSGQVTVGLAIQINAGSATLNNYNVSYSVWRR